MGNKMAVVGKENNSYNLSIGQKFNDFEEFDKYFQEYRNRTQQIFCVSSARTVEQYNKVRSKKLDTKLKYAYVKYTCKFGGRERHRGTGIRHVQRSNKRECPAVVYISGIVEPGVLVIQSANLVHTCTVEKHDDTHPEVCSILPDAAQSAGDTVLTFKISVADIASYLGENGGKNITLQLCRRSQSVECPETEMQNGEVPVYEVKLVTSKDDDGGATVGSECQPAVSARSTGHRVIAHRSTAAKPTDLLLKPKRLRQVTCSVCSELFPSKRALNSHAHVHNGDTAAQVSSDAAHDSAQDNCIGGAVYESGASENDSVAPTAPTTTVFPLLHTCGQCSKQFRHLSRLKAHERSHAGEKPYACSHCGKSYTTPGSRKLHETVHTGVKAFLCTYCGQEFRDSSGLRKHIRIHTGEKPYACETCGARFTQRCHWKEHQLTHTDVRPFACMYCPKMFKDRSKLRVHEMIHGGVKPHACTECGKMFRRSSYLGIHMRTHTGTRPYTCLQCAARFPHLSSLKVHMRRRHTTERPHACSRCAKRFATASTLHVHERTHTGERRYGCSHCSRRFAQSGQLVQHMRVHTGEKPFTCEHCDTAFARIEHLKAHIDRMHDGTRPFACDDCTESFLLDAHLARHRGLVHGASAAGHRCLTCRRYFVDDVELLGHDCKAGIVAVDSIGIDGTVDLLSVCSQEEVVWCELVVGESCNMPLNSEQTYTTTDQCQGAAHSDSAAAAEMLAALGAHGLRTTKPTVSADAPPNL